MPIRLPSNPMSPVKPCISCDGIDRPGPLCESCVRKERDNIRKRLETHATPAPAIAFSPAEAADLYRLWCALSAVQRRLLAKMSRDERGQLRGGERFSVDEVHELLDLYDDLHRRLDPDMLRVNRAHRLYAQMLAEKNARSAP